MEQPRCSKCGSQDPKAFARKDDGYQNYCKSCKKEYYQSNKERHQKVSNRGNKNSAIRLRNNEVHQRSRAKTLGVEIIEEVSINALYRRDGNACGICKLPVVRTQATLDHIVPLSRGGHHTLGNLQLAHKSCNLKKSNKVTPKQ